MAQPIRKNVRSKTVSTKKAVRGRGNRGKKGKNHPEYGTSKLEERFKANFLDALGIEYVYQFKAESIGRYFDFMIPSCRVILEVDGDYYHSYGLVYEQMSPMQKHNKRVDEQKDHWAFVNGYELIRIWEHDINKNPEKVMEMLKKRLDFARDKKNKADKKNKRH